MSERILVNSFMIKCLVCFFTLVENVGEKRIDVGIKYRTFVGYDILRVDLFDQRKCQKCTRTLIDGVDRRY